MLLIAVRAIVLYALLVIVMRLMGKRQIGQLQPFELVVTIVIAELAVIPMSNTGIPLMNGIIGILVLLAAEIFLSLIVLYSERARGIICGTPTIVIENGQPIPENLRKLRMNINDLLEQLRNKEYPNISDIAYALLENNGTLNVIPKASARPPTVKDLGMANITDPTFPITLILDGKINQQNLQIAGITEDTLLNQAKAQKIENPEDIFFAQYNTTGQIDFYLKGKDEAQ
ncbi:MAG: YetF domain-containing protein [Dethiobacteria bacterium]